jgi:hypothetical protein
MMNRKIVPIIAVTSLVVREDTCLYTPWFDFCGQPRGSRQGPTTNVAVHTAARGGAPSASPWTQRGQSMHQTRG